MGKSEKMDERRRRLFLDYELIIWHLSRRLLLKRGRCPREKDREKEFRVLHLLSLSSLTTILIHFWGPKKCGCEICMFLFFASPDFRFRCLPRWTKGIGTLIDARRSLFLNGISDALRTFAVSEVHTIPWISCGSRLENWQNRMNKMKVFLGAPGSPLGNGYDE